MIDHDTAIAVCDAVRDGGAIAFACALGERLLVRMGARWRRRVIDRCIAEGGVSMANDAAADYIEKWNDDRMNAAVWRGAGDAPALSGEEFRTWIDRSCDQARADGATGQPLIPRGAAYWNNDGSPGIADDAPTPATGTPAVDA